MENTLSTSPEKYRKMVSFLEQNDDVDFITEELHLNENVRFSFVVDFIFEF